jgi:hypothetical protein
MRELLSKLNGRRAARIARLAGMTREELDSVGGVEEDAWRCQGWPRVVKGSVRRRDNPWSRVPGRRYRLNGGPVEQDR